MKFLVAPIEIITDNGQVVGVKCREMSLGDFDRSGRRRPTTTENDFIVETDQVIAAIGQSLGSQDVFGGMDIRLNASKYVDINPVTGQTSVPWVFAGGDASMGPSSVAEAVGCGERAAVGIDKFLTGEEHAFWRESRPVDTLFDPDADPAPYQRTPFRLIPVEKRRNNFAEVEQPWTEKEARREAQRCLRCDYRGTC
jgi:NADH-quinone oxidoreductase subunit F